MNGALTIRRPDDWHVHLRRGAMLDAVVSYTARQFARAIVMPNLSPPITTIEAAIDYRAEILAAAARAGHPRFTPLMTAYLTDGIDGAISVIVVAPKGDRFFAETDDGVVQSPLVY